ncbi:hypothetical protein ACIQAA_06000, partial [Neobacillus sp. NPDC093182]
VVRIKGLFGQVKQEKPLRCQNQGSIWTGEARKADALSESRVYSDRRSKKTWCVVRIKGLFGQVKQEKPLRCQNQGSIWTGEARNHRR